MIVPVENGYDRGKPDLEKRLGTVFLKQKVESQARKGKKTPKQNAKRPSEKLRKVNSWGRTTIEPACIP